MLSSTIRSSTARTLTRTAARRGVASTMTGDYTIVDHEYDAVVVGASVSARGAAARDAADVPGTGHALAALAGRREPQRRLWPAT